MPSRSDAALVAGAVRPQIASGPAGRSTGPIQSEADSQPLRPVGDGFQLRPAPSREPPFDDEPISRRLSLVGARDQQLPFAVSAAASSRRRLTRASSPEPPTARDDLPEPSGFARRFAIAVIEAATGRRTASQLSSHTSPGVQAGLVRDAGRISRLGTANRPASLHSVHVAEPVDGVVEATAIVKVGLRYRAIAFRLEGLNGRWRCVRLQIG